MDVGLSIFPTAYAIHPTVLAREAEARGFESLFFIEHTHIPASRRTPYPAGGELPSIYWESYDPFPALAMAAAVTERIKIGTGICLVPEHHPIALAKRVASLDVLSGGRFVFGIGAGWNAEELENHGVRFEDRWKVTREHVLAMKACWTEKEAEFHGEFVDFDPVWVEPKPAQQPHPPVLIGASSRFAMPRVVEYADGWMPIGPMTDFDARLAELDRLCAEAGRDRAGIQISAFGAGPDPEQLERFEKLGVQRVILALPTVDEAQALRLLDDYRAALG